MQDDASFGYWIQRRRKALDLTQAQLGQRVGCSGALIRKIEADERRPSKEIAARLANCLQIAAEDRPTFLRFARGEAAAQPSAPLPAPPVSLPRPQPHPVHTSLPTPATPLIGRAQEVATLCTLLEGATVRLLTLVGPPGIGKTRLSLQVATELRTAFPDGVFVVDLAPISDPALVLSTIATTLGIKEVDGQSLIESLKAYLRDTCLLLVLDNFEQILGAAPLIGELLLAAPRLKALATSRVPLHLYGEHEYAVPPLAVPDLRHLPSLETLLEIESVRLFVQRAQAVRFDFALTPENAAAVAEICIRLDGLPLAIELAAAWIKLFTAPALLRRLSRSLDLLTGGAQDLAPRQRTLRNAIAWSYDLLAPAEQALLARLGVFVGGWTLEAAEAVCKLQDELDVLEGMAALVDHSLVQQAAGAAPGGYPEPRFMMLETIREYALEQLHRVPSGRGTRRGEGEVVRRRHAAYFLQLAEEAERQLDGPGQAVWLERLEAEHDNLRAALAWSQAPVGSAETGLRLAAALADFWLVRGYMREGRAWLVAVLAQAGAAAPSLVRARVLGLAGVWASMQGDQAAARASYDECLALYRALGDRRGTAQTLATLGIVACCMGDYAEAAGHCAESLALFQDLGDRYGSAHVLQWLGAIARDQGDYARALPLFAESLAIWREVGDKRAIADALLGMGDALRRQGEYARAAALYQEALALAQEVGDWSKSALAKSNLGRTVHAQGDDAQALALLEASVAWQREAGHSWGLMWALHHLSAVVYAQGDAGRARALLRETLGLQRQMGQKRLIAGSLERLAGLAARQGQAARAARLFGAAAALRAAIGAPLPPSERADYEREVVAAQSQLDEATFAAAWVEGQAMTLEQAIAYALDEDA